MSTESVETPDYTSLVGSRVKIVYKSDVTSDDSTQIDAVEIAAVVEAFNGEMNVIMVREKGKTMGFLIDLKDLIEISLDDKGSKVIKSKKLKEVDVANARQHLADRHGYPLESVNGMSDEEAFDVHEDTDHSDLSHHHQDEQVQDESAEESDEDEDQSPPANSGQ